MSLQSPFLWNISPDLPRGLHLRHLKWLLHETTPLLTAPTEGFFFILTPHRLGISIPEGFMKTPSPLEFIFFLCPHSRTPWRFQVVSLMENWGMACTVTVISFYYFFTVVYCGPTVQHFAILLKVYNYDRFFCWVDKISM